MSYNSRFVDQGFVVFRNVIPSTLIDECLHFLSKAKRRKSYLYYSQSTHRWSTPNLSDSGHLIESILNPSQQIQAPNFARSVRNLLYNDSLYRSLCSVSTDTLDFVSWQDMAFDQSTGTIDHLDSWYLDTESPGGVIGAWFALEDIKRESGPFFVCPGSHHLGPISRNDVPNHDEFLSLIQKRIIDHKLTKLPILLNKGDLLLWHSQLIHGSFTPTDFHFSRKSLTSHFYPLGKRRNDSTTTDGLINDLRSLRSTSHPRIFRNVRFGRSPLFYACAGPLLLLKQRIGMISSRAWNMRR